MQISGRAEAEGQPLGVGAQAALLTCGLFTTIGLFSPGLLLPQIERAFAATPNVELLAQLIGAISSFFFAIGAPVAGALINKFGCRAVIGPSLILLAAAGTAPALLDSLWAMVATRALVGLAVAGAFTGGLTGIGAMADYKRARMFGWYSVVGGGAAMLVFPAVGAIARTGWRLPFAVNLVALLVLPLALFLPKALGRSTPAAPGERSGGPADLLGPAMLSLLAVAAYTGMSMFLPPLYSPLYLSSLGVMDTRVLAIPVTLSSVVAVGGAAGYGRLHRLLGIAGVFAATLIGVGCALLLAGTTSSIGIFSMAIALQGGLIGVIAPNLNAAALAAAPAGKSGEAMGLANAVMFGSQLLFPFIAAWIRSEMGLGGVFLVFAVCALAIGLTILTRIMARRRRLVPG